MSYKSEIGFTKDFKTIDNCNIRFFFAASHNLCISSFKYAISKKKNAVKLIYSCEMIRRPVGGHVKAIISIVLHLPIWNCNREMSVLILIGMFLFHCIL